MSGLFTVQRHATRPTLKVENVLPSLRKNERATLDLTIEVNGKPQVQIFGAKLVEGKEGAFIAGPSCPADGGRWINLVSIGRELQTEIIESVERKLTEGGL